jgi:dienelactone hydrolase
MIRIKVLSFAFVLLSVASYAQDSLSFIRRSSEVLDLLNRQNYQAVVDRLDSATAARLDSARLGGAWRNLLKRGGPFNGVLDTVCDHQPNYDVVILQALFGTKKMDIKTVYGAGGALKGVFFTATDTREKYHDPAYYRPDLFEEVPGELRNGENKMKSVLTVPKNRGRVPAVVLVHGTGPNDKDETVGATKIFRDLAVGLSANGIAVFRYDKRTRAMAASLMRNKNILTPEEETVADAVAAVEMLKKDPRIDTTRIWLAGHSMGAYLLPQVVKRAGFVKGMVLLSPHGRPLQDMLLEQDKYLLASAEGKSEAERTAIIDSITTEVARVGKLTAANAGDSARILGLHPAYWLYLQKYDAVATAKSSGKSILILHGGRDFQVSDKDFQKWVDAFNGNASVATKRYADLNHFYIKGSGKSLPDEYFKAGNVEEAVVLDIAGWINNGSLPK